MAQTTTHLGLTLPDLDDSRDITVINGNMELLDTAVFNLQNMGSENAGKFLVIANDGTVTPTEIQMASGGTY